MTLVNVVTSTIANFSSNEGSIFSEGVIHVLAEIKGRVGTYLAKEVKSDDVTVEAQFGGVTSLYTEYIPILFTKPGPYVEFKTW